MGTYISQDPLGLAASTNAYQYAINPLLHADPFGERAAKLSKGTLYLVDKYPPGGAESRQLRRFVGAWNDEIQANGGKMRRRCATRAASERWKRKCDSDTPKGSVERWSVTCRMAVWEESQRAARQWLSTLA